MKTLDVIIYGSGGAAKGYHWHLSDPDAVVQDRDGHWCQPRVIGYLDDDVARHGQYQHGVPILGGMNWLAAKPGAAVFVGIGIPHHREQVIARLMDEDVWFPTFVSSRAQVAMGCELGEGTFIYTGSIVNVDATLGAHCFLNMNVTIGHDSRIGSYSVAYPGATVSGNVTIGTAVALGANSTIVQGRHIGDYAVLGAMSCAVEDIPSYATAVGIPARIIRNGAYVPELVQ